MSAKILLEQIDVNGVDTQARAATFRQCFSMRQKLTGTTIPILRGVTFKAQKGDRIGIMGRNGSGKSSLLKVISGVYPICAGKREVSGTLCPLIEMGAGFDGELSGRRNIKLSFAYRGRLREYSKKLEDQIIEFASLGEKIDLPFKTYSSGMQARLAFASAIFQNPEILLLDEILATGDAGFVEKSQAAILDQLKRSAIGVIISHNIGDLKKLCNRFMLMEQGSVVMEGSFEEVSGKYQQLLGM